MSHTFIVDQHAADDPGTQPLSAPDVDVLLFQHLDVRCEAHGLSLGHLVGAHPTANLPVPHNPDMTPAPLSPPCTGFHPLVNAVHLAFDRHYPLELSPDDIWLCIAQGFAYHVLANAELLRKTFVRHEGKKELSVQRDAFTKGSPSNDWPSVFGDFSRQIGEHIGPKRHELLVADFSTTGPIERAASEVVLMEAMQSYFSYNAVSACGIPRVTLLGTVDDWKQLRRRAEALAEYDLRWWLDALLPVLDQFVRAADGEPEPAFWTSIYKKDSRSGGPYITGWINAFFPYVKSFETGRFTSKNHLPSDWRRGGYATAESFPYGVSVVPFRWQLPWGACRMLFLAGFFGVHQDEVTLALRPSIGWGVCDDRR